MLIGKPTPQGYAVITDRQTGKAIKEADTYTCNHARMTASGWQPCQRIIHVPAGRTLEEVADFCRGCMKMICAQCADTKAKAPIELTGQQFACTAWMRVIERQEDIDARRRDLLRALGV